MVSVTMQPSSTQTIESFHVKMLRLLRVLSTNKTDFVVYQRRLQQATGSVETRAVSTVARAVKLLEVPDRRCIRLHTESKALQTWWPPGCPEPADAAEPCGEPVAGQALSAATDIQNQSLQPNCQPSRTCLKLPRSCAAC